MRLRHIFAEAGAGLRRNLTMTLAVMVTMWVSLSLFGTGILAQQEVDLVKGKWYDKIEVTVFLCSEVTQGDNCDPGAGVTDAQKVTIRNALQTNPEVSVVDFESKHEAFLEFQQAYEGNPLQGSLTEDQMQESFRVKLKNPEQYEGVVSAVRGLAGVQTVQDLRKFLDPFFSWVNLLQRGTIIASVLLLVAAALQIGNTIRLAAFARRREIGIMRLVGASNFYITLPFLLESVIAALVGVGLACGTLAAGVYFIVIRKARVSIQSIGWIGWHQAGLAMAAVAIVGLLLAVVPTLITTRKYLRV